MKITILTLFPEMFESYFSNSIIKRAIAKGIVSFECVNIRDFTQDKHHRVDNPPVGGGAGLIMMCQPVYDALMSVKDLSSKVLLTSPRGSRFTQQKAQELSKEEHLIFICGHYEGIDERINQYADELISLGDFIMTGGEIAVMAITDAVVRLLPGTISEESTHEESFAQPLLEYPQYTLPYDFNGQKIPDILFCGNHQAIEKWRKKQSLLLTKSLRPDLFNALVFTKEEKKLLKELEENTPPKWEIEALEKGKKFIKK